MGAPGRFICIAFACAAALPPTAAAQTRPSYPPTLHGAALSGWLTRETDIAPAQVVAVSPSAITSVVSLFPNETGARVVVRSEAATADARTRNGAMSWQVSVLADCKTGHVRLGETTGYPERNLIGEGRPIRPAEIEPRTPQAGTPLESVWRFACDPGFKRPLATEGSQAAAPPRTGAPPRSAPPPPDTAAPASNAVVQIAAADNEAAAAADILALQRSFGALVHGRPTRVEPAQVRGRTVYRAVLTGFASRAEAAALCERLKAGGQACFVRAR